MTDAEILREAEAVFDGWYADEARIDRDDFLSRLESRTGVDLPEQYDDPLIKKIKKHINVYRRLET